MTEDEKYEQAVAAAYGMIANCDTQIADGRDFIMLVLGNRRPPTGLRAKLTPQGGPLGEIMNYQEIDGVGQIVARFDPKKVRDFLLAELAKIDEAP